MVCLYHVEVLEPYVPKSHVERTWHTGHRHFSQGMLQSGRTHTAHTHEGLSLSRYVLARLLASWPGGIGMSPWIGLWLCAPNGA